jgi:hypothetical protein
MDVLLVLKGQNLASLNPEVYHTLTQEYDYAQLSELHVHHEVLPSQAHTCSALPSP